MTTAKKLLIGVDVGGTKIQSGLILGTGKVLARNKFETEAYKGRGAVLENIMAAIAAQMKPGVKAIGLGLAGVVDAQKGVFFSGPNLPKDLVAVPIAKLIKKKFGLAPKLDNDVHCFTLAESKFGSAKGFSSVVGLTFGTGIGGGIVFNGALYRGRDNSAGEFGHMTIDRTSEQVCSCGHKGHFEALASGTAMTKMYLEATGNKSAAIEIEKAAAAGDVQAVKIVASVTDAIAIGFANIIHALNPDAIVYGGGLAAMESALESAAAKALESLAFDQPKKTKILKGKLGTDAGMIGAALNAI